MYRLWVSSAVLLTPIMGSSKFFQWMLFGDTAAAERLADFYLLAALLRREAVQVHGDEQFLDVLGIDLWVEFAIAISFSSDLISVEGGTEP